MTSRFWMLQSKAEIDCVNAMLERRFPHTVAILREALEQGDPNDMVYENNPGEYNDVVREIIVLCSWQLGDLSQLSQDALRGVLEEGLTRCFGEPPDAGRLQQTLAIIERKLSAT